MATSNIVKVAAVQAAPISFDLHKSLDKLEKLASKAAQAGADLAVFPYVLILLPSVNDAEDLYQGRDFWRRTRGAILSTLPLVPESLVVRYHPA